MLSEAVDAYLQHVQGQLKKEANVSYDFSSSLILFRCFSPYQGGSDVQYDATIYINFFIFGVQEMLEAEQQGAKKRRLPRGTSEYQAAWITDDIIEGDDDVSEEEEVDAAGNADDVRYNAVIVQPLMSLHASLVFAITKLAKCLVCHMRYSVAGRLLGAFL